MTAVERAIEAQKNYYDLRAPDYLTGAPSDRQTVAPDVRHTRERSREIVDELRPSGHVLELACGPGNFTRELARRAVSVTAVDASPRMIARNRVEVALSNVRYVEADIFTFEPETSYDLVFFGFFLSHVPPSEFDSFWSVVRRCASTGGRVAFVDEDDRAAGHDDVRIVDGVPVARRTLADGREFEVVKVFWDPEALAARLRALDWEVTIGRVGTDMLSGVCVDLR